MKIDLKKNRFVGSGFRCERCDGAGYIRKDSKPGQTSVAEELNFYNSRECPECLGARVVYLYEEPADYSAGQKQDSSFLLKEIELLQKKVKKLTEDKLKLVTHINNLNRK